MLVYAHVTRAQKCNATDHNFTNRNSRIFQAPACKESLILLFSLLNGTYVIRLCLRTHGSGAPTTGKRSGEARNAQPLSRRYRGQGCAISTWQPCLHICHLFFVGFPTLEFDPLWGENDRFSFRQPALLKDSFSDSVVSPRATDLFSDLWAVFLFECRSERCKWLKRDEIHI